MGLPHGDHTHRRVNGPGQDLTIAGEVLPRKPRRSLEPASYALQILFCFPGQCGRYAGTPP